MNISIPSILFSLGGKCLLNWTLMFLQRTHVCRSFLGIFGVSLAVIDTTMTFFIAFLYIHTNVFLLGLQLSRYHICLLVQILGQVYSTLQWPVVVLAALDHFCTVTRKVQSTNARWFVCLFVTIFLWYLAALYVLLLSDFLPVLDDVSHEQIHQCWVSHTSQILQVAVFLLLTLGCAALHAGCSQQSLKCPPLRDQITVQCRRSVVQQAVHMFLNTWALFLVFLAVPLLLPVGIPAYLSLNTAWLCFLNSLLIAVVLCVMCSVSQLTQGLAAVPPDSFCEWRFKFSLAAEDRT